MRDGILLLFPPSWSCRNPYLSVPSLSAYMRASGWHVDTIDANLELHLDALERATDGRLQSELDTTAKALGDKEALSRNEYGRYKEVRLAQAVLPGLARGIPAAIDEVRHPSSAQGASMARGVLRKAWRSASAPYYPVFSLSTDADAEERTVAYCLHSAGRFFTRVVGDAPNPFLDIAATYLEERLRSREYLLAGVSIAAREQLLPGLTICHALKSAMPDCHVTIGGPLVTILFSANPQFREVLRVVDSVVMGEGELPLAALAEQLKAGQTNVTVPNVFTSDSSGVTHSAAAGGFCEDLDQLPRPDFTDMPLDEYLGPVEGLPLLSSRGCYWNHCAFCALCSTFGGTYRERSMELVLDDIEQYQAETGATYFDFDDEALSPARVRSLVAGIQRRGMSFKWSMLARAETAFREDLLGRAADCGLRLVTFGIESGSDAVLDLMRKGTSASAGAQVVRAAHRAGVWVNIFIMFGFPGEAADDREASVQFLDDNSECLDSVNFGVFRLEWGSAVFADPAAFNVQVPSAPTGLETDASFLYDGRNAWEEGRDQYFEAEERFRQEPWSSYALGGLTDTDIIHFMCMDRRASLDEFTSERSFRINSLRAICFGERPGRVRLAPDVTALPLCHTIVEGGIRVMYVLVNPETGSGALCSESVHAWLTHPHPEHVSDEYRVTCFYSLVPLALRHLVVVQPD